MNSLLSNSQDEQVHYEACSDLQIVGKANARVLQYPGLTGESECKPLSGSLC